MKDQQLIEAWCKILSDYLHNLITIEQYKIEWEKLRKQVSDDTYSRVFNYLKKQGMFRA